MKHSVVEDIIKNLLGYRLKFGKKGLIAGVLLDFWGYMLFVVIIIVFYFIFSLEGIGTTKVPDMTVQGFENIDAHTQLIGMLKTPLPETLPNMLDLRRVNDDEKEIIIKLLKENPQLYHGENFGMMIARMPSAVNDPILAKQIIFSVIRTLFDGVQNDRVLEISYQNYYGKTSSLLDPYFAFEFKTMKEYIPRDQQTRGEFVIYPSRALNENLPWTILPGPKELTVKIRLTGDGK